MYAKWYVYTTLFQLWRFIWEYNLFAVKLSFTSVYQIPFQPLLRRLFWALLATFLSKRLTIVYFLRGRKRAEIAPNRVASSRSDLPYVFKVLPSIAHTEWYNPPRIRAPLTGAPNGNFRENICSEDDLRTRIFGTFVVKFLPCLPLLGFSNTYKMV